MNSAASFPLGPSSIAYFGGFASLFGDFNYLTKCWDFKENVYVSHAYFGVSDNGGRILLANDNNYLLYYWKKDFLSAFFLLFQKLNWESSIVLPYWDSFLLMYCCHKKNRFVWLE